ncbi:hypothetical protein BDV3_005954 [Batrachochytrium dendrobatidis]
MPSIMTSSSSNSVKSSGSSGFGKLLAHSDKRIRDKAVKSLQEYLIANASSLSDLDMLKLWKGLYCCFWMSDKPLVQQSLAQDLAQAATKLPISEGLRYICCFWKILIKEWYNIDRLRLDKFYFLCRQFHFWTFRLIIDHEWDKDIIDKVMIILEQGPLSINVASVPNSLQYHTSKAFFEELIKAIKSVDNDMQLPLDAFERLIAPCFGVLERSYNQVYFKHVIDDIFSLWLFKDTNADEDKSADDMTSSTAMMVQSCISPKQLLERLGLLAKSDNILKNNKKELHAFNKTLAKLIGVEYTDPTFSIGMKAAPIPTARKNDESGKNMNSKSKKQKVTMVVMDEAVEACADIALWNVDEVERESTNTDCDTVVTTDDKDDVSKTMPVQEMDSTETVSSTSSKKRKRKSKSVARLNATEKSDSDAAPDCENDAAKESNEVFEDSVAEDVESFAIAESVDCDDNELISDALDASQHKSPDRKSVSWGQKLRVKTFFKLKPICALSEVKTPVHPPAPKSALRESPAVFPPPPEFDGVDMDFFESTPTEMLDFVTASARRPNSKRNKKNKKGKQMRK